MKLTDMRNKKQKPAKGHDTISVMDGEKYPYGLQISLGKDQIEAMGIDIKSFPVGTSITIKADGKITSLSEREGMGKESSERRLEIQITKLAMDSKDSFDKSFSEATAAKEK